MVEIETTPADVMAEDCAQCGVKAGEACATVTGLRVYHHLRWGAAERTVAAAQTELEEDVS